MVHTKEVTMENSIFDAGVCSDAKINILEKSFMTISLYSKDEVY